MLRKILQIYIFFISTSAIGQEFSGVIYDAKTNEPVIGASVYFNGSSIGTISDLDGKFTIKAPSNSHAFLIISHLGYVLKKIENPIQTGHELKIYLVEEVQKIPEVVLTSDPFTRKQKLRVFRKEFLGDTRASNDCRILNEDGIELFFNSYDNTLTAFAKEAIVIENEYLGYLIKFDVDEFKIHFKRKSLDRIDNIKFTIIAGYSRYTDISDSNPKILERRENAFFGSPMHFMRTLWNNNWSKENFVLKKNFTDIEPNQILKYAQQEESEFREVIFQINDFVVYYKNRGNRRTRSTVKLTGDNSSLLIDRYGVYKPFKNLIFGDYMADLRIGDMLPIDYKL